MSEENADVKHHLNIFGYPLRDWLLAIVFLTGAPGAAFLVGGMPSDTTRAINTQAETISNELTHIREAVNDNFSINSRRIDRVEGTIESFNRLQNAKLDSMRQTMIEGYSNLDGYFRGRLDQLLDIP